MQGVGHHIHPVHRTRPHRRHQDCGRAIHVMDPFGHEASGVLMFGQMELDACPFERIHKGQHLATGHAKRVAAACIIKALRQYICRTYRGSCHRHIL